MPSLLFFVEKTHPILREVMPEITDFSDPALRQLIDDMCYSIMPPQLKAASAPHESAAGMAANQWGINKRVFIFTPDGSGEGNRMEVMINPSYVPLARFGETQPKLITGFEGCFSIPLTVGKVNRYEAISATYYDIHGKKIECIMEGWEARVFQHETDHLNGKLFDGKCDQFAGPDCVERIVFNNDEEMEAYWMNQVRLSRER